MEGLLSTLTIKINESIFLKDPDSSALGRKIIEGSIELMDELGLEAFSFGKLAKHIQSTEASIYRYFESKHKLLLYLISWYWRWMEYRLVFTTSNIESPIERLERAITLLSEPVVQDSSYGYINEVKLGNIVINESSKTYLTKVVDEENAYGVFGAYKQLVQRVSDIITEIVPGYAYPHMLVSTVIEGAHHQRFFQAHLPRLSDAEPDRDTITAFYIDLVKNTLTRKQ